MRLLHVTDTHLGAERRVIGAPDPKARRDDHERALALALAPALRGEVDAVVHSGDLFDRSSPPREVATRAVALLREVARRVPVVLIPGNHDRRGLRRHLPPTPGLTVVDDAERVEVAGVALGCVPFRRDAEAWAHAARRVEAELLVAHQAFDGAAVPGLVFRVGAQRDTLGEAHLPPRARHVLCGHIHPRQVLRIGAAEVVCTGSSERTSFSERDQTKGYAIWELGREVRWRWVDLPARPMRVISREDDLHALPEGALVRLAGALAGRVDAERAVLGRGAWLAPTAPRTPPPPTPQLGLFR